MNYDQLPNKIKVKAIKNVLRSTQPDFLEHLLKSERYDLPVWFVLSDSKEGYEYWMKWIKK